jgi:hypothetical protein
MDYVDLLQWPAMLMTVAAAWLVGSQRPVKRSIGFWIFLGSNLLWAIWGWHARAYALIVLQICLAVINIRGAWRNEASTESSPRAA